MGTREGEGGLLTPTAKDQKQVRATPCRVESARARVCHAACDGRMKCREDVEELMGLLTPNQGLSLKQHLPQGSS